MKQGMKQTKMAVMLGALAILGIGSIYPSFAEDEINLEELRRTFGRQAAAAPQAPVAAPGKGFALSDSEVEAVNKQYEAEEAELLKKLSSPEAQALLKDAATGNNELPAARSGGMAPIAITARAGTQLRDLRPDAESAPLIRAVRPGTDDLIGNPRAGLKPLITEETLIAPKPVTRTEKAAGLAEDKSAALASADSALKSLQTQLASLRKSNSDLSTKLQKSDSQVSELTKQLEEAKNRLMMAETEVERLASVIETRNRSAAMRLGGTAQTAPQQAAGVTQAVQRAQIKASDDTPVATVVSEKANLRTGPGADNSPLMSVSRGTRLVVETKHGDWYRVISPTGTRAWVSSDVVAFGPTSQSSPSSTVRIRGFNAALENETFGADKSTR